MNYASLITRASADFMFVRVLLHVDDSHILEKSPGERMSSFQISVLKNIHVVYLSNVNSSHLVCLILDI